MNSYLEVSWCQAYMGLHYHMEEALIEKNLEIKDASPCPPIALFSRKYYNEICELNHKKIYDYCFIGSIKSHYEHRKWIIEFAKRILRINQYLLIQIMTLIGYC